MGLFSRFSKKNAPKPSAVVTEFTTLSQFINGYEGSLNTNVGQRTQGYMNNPYVRRACDLYGAFIALPETVYYDINGDEIDDPKHPLIALMRKPNPNQNERQFKKQVGTELGIYGESFVYPEITVKGVTLTPINPERVQAVTTGDPLHPVSKWIVACAEMGSMVLEPDELIHIKLHNPDPNNPRGCSPMESAKKSIEQQNAIRDWNIAVTKNGGKAGIVLETPNRLADDVYERTKKDLQDGYGGKANAGKNMLLEDGLTAKSLGMTAVDMDFSTGTTIAAKEIAIGYQIDSSILGDSSNRTYSNLTEAFKQTILTTAIPLNDLVMETLWDWLKTHLGAKFPDVDKMTYDVEVLTDLTVDPSALYANLETSTFLTINEKRKKLGYEPIDDPNADIPLIGMGLAPLSDTSESSEPDITDELPFLKGDL